MNKSQIISNCCFLNDDISSSVSNKPFMKVELHLNIYFTIINFISTMFHTAICSELTKVDYQIIESNFIWKIRNPAELHRCIRSEFIDIPVIDAKW